MIPFTTIKVNYYTSNGTKDSFTRLVHTQNPFLKVLTNALTKIKNWSEINKVDVSLNPEFIEHLYKHNRLSEIEKDLIILIPHPNQTNVTFFLESHDYKFNDKNWDFIVTLADLIYWETERGKKDFYYDSFEFFMNLSYL